MTQTPYPAGGALIDWHNGEWQVPDNPWIGCIAGDGIGPEIMQASRRVWDAAIKAAYGERCRWVKQRQGRAVTPSRRRRSPHCANCASPSKDR